MGGFHLCFSLGVCRIQCQFLFLQKPLSRLDAPVRAILRAGLYQAKYMQSVPVHAAVSESVALCRRMKKASAAGLVNAVLRRAQRESETLLAEVLPSLHGVHYAAKRVKKWMKPSRRSVGLAFMPAAAKVVYQPVGVVGGVLLERRGAASLPWALAVLALLALAVAWSAR